MSTRHNNQNEKSQINAGNRSLATNQKREARTPADIDWYIPRPKSQWRNANHQAENIMQMPNDCIINKQNAVSGMYPKYE